MLSTFFEMYVNTRDIMKPVQVKILTQLKPLLQNLGRYMCKPNKKKFMTTTVKLLDTSCRSLCNIFCRNHQDVQLNATLSHFLYNFLRVFSKLHLPEQRHTFCNSVLDATDQIFTKTEMKNTHIGMVSISFSTPKCDEGPMKGCSNSTSFFTLKIRIFCYRDLLRHFNTRGIRLWLVLLLTHNSGPVTAVQLNMYIMKYIFLTASYVMLQK